MPVRDQRSSSFPASVSFVDDLGQRVAIGEVEYVGAIEVGRSIALAKIVGVVAVVEKAQAALFIRCMGEGVGNAGLKSVADLLFEVCFESVVGRDASRRVSLRLRRISDIRNAKVDIPAFVVVQHGAVVASRLGRIVDALREEMCSGSSTV